MNKSDQKITKKTIFTTVLFLFVFCVFCQKNSIFAHFLNKKGQKEVLFANNSFKSGETLRYKISYGKKNKRGGLWFAANATLNVKDSVINDSINVYSISGYGKTTRLFSLFLKVNHHYKSIINKETLSTIESRMNIQEGKHIDFDHTIVALDSVLKKSNANDILGAFYKLRTISEKELNQQDTILFSYYYNNDIYDSYVVILEQELLKTKFGKINTLKCAPLLEKGRMFRENSQAFVWVTNDEMHIPLKLEIPILVGSIYVTLNSYNQTTFNLN